MYDELVMRLRAQADAERYFVGEDMLYDKAADAIEELKKVLDAVSDAHNEGYDVGYWAGRRDYDPKWISMTERLPEENAPCIVYNKDYGPMVGWRVDGERFRIPGSHFPDHPTHWMPLPEPPEELIGTDMRGGIRRDDAGNVIDWGITGPPGDVGKTEEGE